MRQLGNQMGVTSYSAGMSGRVAISGEWQRPAPLARESFLSRRMTMAATRRFRDTGTGWHTWLTEGPKHLAS